MIRLTCKYKRYCSKKSNCWLQGPLCSVNSFHQNTYFVGIMKTAGRILCLLFFAFQSLEAQVVLQEEIRSPFVVAVKLFRRPNQQSFPIVKLGEPEALELQFDDMQTSTRAYYYTYVLCNADWTPANLSSMDYIRGFSQMRLTQYRFSSATMSRYVHYSASLPATNAMPSRAGNYLLKVFENGDTSKLLFSRKILVVNEQASVAVRMQQPFAQENFLSHQKVIADVAFKNVEILNPAQEVKLVVMQNNRWDNARLITHPTFIRGRNFEYSDENTLVFEGGKEWRWLDLRSFRLQSDRVASVNYNKTPYDVFVRPDTVRSPLRYFFYGDANGRFVIANLENVNPWWQSDIARVHFTFLPQEPEKFRNVDLFLFGEMTGFQLNDKSKMEWNENLQAFETSLMLKNGFYSYAYVTRPQNKPDAPGSFFLTEGSRWETENDYRILVYYTPFGARSDELVGIAEVNSLNYFNPGR